ncbi:hypothetical protein QNA24_07720 [Rhodococcus qingshengii]|uniref:hypothetical protein n=1 Tax=Rhodococcus qingshengii TaxID=334542 RepID=UPI0024B918D1|nr:hypothetical protein [Rhodococcus qingshengii]MDJ0486235.1 hypothetical protein [Rhodococcus qingshengii]
MTDFSLRAARIQLGALLAALALALAIVIALVGEPETSINRSWSQQVNASLLVR